MADTLTTKKVTELTENTAMSDDDLFMVGSAGTASLRRLKWSNIWNTIKTAILGKLVANNLTTTAAGYLLDARQGKALDDKISELNTDLSFNGFSIKCFTFVSTSDSGGYINIPYNGNNLTYDSCGGLFVCTVQSCSYINANNCFLNSNNVWRSKLTDNSGNPMIDKTINCIAIAFIKN